MIERGFVRVCLAGGLALGVSACNARDDVDTATLVSAMTARTVGLAYLEDDRYLEAATELTRLIDLLPREAIGYANLALARFRTGDVAGARESMERAVSIEPDDADIRYNLAVMLEGANLVNEADATLRNNVAAAPDHVMSLYALARLGRTAGSVPSAEVLQLLGDIVARRPGNLMARLELIDALLATGDAASAVAHVEFVAQLVPDLPPEVGPLYRETLQLVRGGEAPAAQGPATAVHNLLRSTPLYQAGVERLVGRPGLPGIAIQHFRQALLDRMATEELVHANVRFAVSRTLALNIPPGSGWDAGMVDASDFDGDGDADILVTLRGADGSPGSVVLLDNRGDSIVDVTRTIPIMRGTAVTSAKFTDYDDDGNVDVIVTLTDGVRLYRNNGNVFTDVTTRSGLAGAPGSNASISGDFDHDGDLDLYFARNGPNRFYRNDGSGVFEDRTGATGLAGAGRSTQLALGDFDNDLDLDLLVGNADGGLELFANLRQGRFHDVASDAGIASEGVQSFTVNDMTNDGSLDMLRLGSGGAELLVNAGDGTFGVDTTARSLFASFDPRVAQFLDFDNDGQLDIAIRSAAGGLGLLRNEGQGRLSDATASLPRLAAAAVVMGVADFDADGDIDIVVVTTDGMVSVLRNDGGNTNNYLQVQLAGLGRGSNKNNHYGIGARLEVTAGESYQSRVVTDQVTHIGLGRHATADAVRITWTNGVPQTAVRVAGNQLVVEDQILKGSCAFLYAWNGEEYVFVTDMMWKSALGMPLGIMQSEMAYAPPDASREYLLIPGSQLQPHDGEYALQITEELWEVAYLDRLELVVYDHPDSIDLFVDEKFVPPFVTDVGIYHVSERHSPVSASDQNGVDVLARIAAHDFDYVSNLVAGEYQGITEMHDLVLGLGDFGAGREVRLFLTGWIFPTDASINVAVS
ncbi:MAG: FG-GAP-like repeat-containing protein, partial [Gemmatimonadales bacterium]